MQIQKYETEISRRSATTVTRARQRGNYCRQPYPCCRRLQQGWRNRRQHEPSQHATEFHWLRRWPLPLDVNPELSASDEIAARRH